MDPNFNFNIDSSIGGGDASNQMNADSLWKRFDEQGISSQITMFPFGQNVPSAGPSGSIQGSSTAGAGVDATSSPAAAKAETKTSKRASAKSDGSKSSLKTKKARSALSEAEKIARREKHNQVEIRRRKRINQRFNELGDICGCDSKQKRNILTSAIDKLKEFEERIQQLKGNLESLALDGDNGDADADEKQESDMQLQQDHNVVDHRSVFMKSGVPLHVSGFDGRILDCNEKFAQLFGFTRDVILANQVTVFSLTSPDSLAVTFGVVGHLMKGNPRAQVDNLMIGPGGRLIKVKVTAWLIRDGGRPKYFMSMMVPDPNFQAPATSSSQGPLQIQSTAPSVPSNNMLPFLGQQGTPQAQQVNVQQQPQQQQSMPMTAQQMQLQQQLNPALLQHVQGLSGLQGISTPPSNMMRGQSADVLASMSTQQPQVQQLQQQQLQQQQQQLLLQQLLLQQQMQQAQQQPQLPQQASKPKGQTPQASPPPRK